MRLALDHHYSPVIAEHLRRLGHDVVAAQERGWEREDDESLLTLCAEELRGLLTLCAEELRGLLTNNVGDFATIARSWAAEDRSHAGLIFTSDASLPRGRGTVDRYVKALDGLCRVHRSDDAFRDQVHWL